MISGELDLPAKVEKCSQKGILRREWPLKYLEQVPALIVLFIDLDWDHPSWAEQKAVAESKCASIRASSRHGSRLAVVLLQERSLPTPGDDPLATERAHELCQICQLTPKQLFVLPVLGDLQGYVSKLESAFHDLAQGFYQQKLKNIRARSIPNNTPSLVVRQLFKLAFLSELRQDTHTAFRNYRLAYEQCKDNTEHWDGIDIFEWRSVVGLLNYKMCELCFLHSMAVEAINQMRRHQAIFFSLYPGVYPTPQLASIEQQLWKAKQCWHFAQLFEQAVVSGLTALATLNPGTHLALAASLYSAANEEISALKLSTSVTSAYPSPDPLSQTTVFFGQRPWRVGYDGLAPINTEQDAVNAILHTLVVNHDGVIQLLTAARAQFKKYGCHRMQNKVMSEMADVYYSSGDCTKALQLWSLVVREGIPPAVRQCILNKAVWAAFRIASVKDFIWCCIQLMSSAESVSAEYGLLSVLASQPPHSPFVCQDVTEDKLSQYSQLWKAVLGEKQFFSIQIGRLDTFLSVEAAFLCSSTAHIGEKIPLRVSIFSSAEHPLKLSSVTVSCDLLGRRRVSDDDPIFQMERKDVTLIPKKTNIITGLFNLTVAQLNEGQVLMINRVSLEVGDRHSLMFGQFEFDGLSLRRSVSNISHSGSHSVTISHSSYGLYVEDNTVVECLVGEVAEALLSLRNKSGRRITNVRLEFKRNEQSSTEASAMLFVDPQNELRSELTTNCAIAMEPDEVISVPLYFSAQLVGNFELQMETSYLLDGEETVRNGKVTLAITAKEPFVVKSGVLSTNGLPVASLLNNSEHILKVDISSNADIIVTNVEWLLADVLSCIGRDEEITKQVEDQLNDGEVISYCCVVAVHSREEDVECPLGRLAVEWKRVASDSSVRSVVPLCRLLVLPCPVTVEAKVFDSPITVRYPIRINYIISSHSMEAIELTVSFDLSDTFMFCGEKRSTFRLLPRSRRSLNIVVMALSAGRLPFPKILLRSPQVIDTILQQSLRTLPATIFILPCSKGLSNSDA